MLLSYYLPVPEPIAQPPKFTTPLSDVQATDGKEVVLTCVVHGQPKPDISWYHNGNNIDKSDDFVINYDKQTGKIDLVIVDCLPDDQGKFRCVATNPAGQATTECTLSVGPPPTEVIEMQIAPEVKVTPKEVVPEEVTRKLSVESGSSRASSDSIKVIKKVVKRTSGTPPKFMKPIQPCVVREGDTCTFTATVTGAPQPEIAWLKDKADLPPNERYVMEFDQDSGICKLSIKDAKPEDVGVYSCRATNLAGRATCTANVVVVRKYWLLFSQSRLSVLKFHAQRNLELLKPISLKLITTQSNNCTLHSTLTLLTAPFRHCYFN